ncbi:unnamed protein product [Amaranthus hypochondriacus]
MSSTFKFTLLALTILVIVGWRVAGSTRVPPEITEDEKSMIIEEVVNNKMHNLQSKRKIDGLKEAMIAHMNGNGNIDCYPDGYRYCVTNAQCCSGYCEWNLPGGSLCHSRSDCWPDGFRGCTFNRDCCSGYCEWFLDELNLCH